MTHALIHLNANTHRLIPSRYPPVSLFDWADSEEELNQIALLEGLTNERLRTECGDLSLIPKGEWISGQGSTPIMAAFTHPGISRFSDGTYGVYYAADNIDTAIAETKFHREIFLSASKEPPTSIQMREYTSKVIQPLIDIHDIRYQEFLSPDTTQYQMSQAFASVLRQDQAYGLFYPSVRRENASCVAIFRPSALTIPVQARHYEYIWDGCKISEIRQLLIYTETA